MSTTQNRDIRYLAEHLLNTELAGLSRREISHLMRISKKLQAQPGETEFGERSGLTRGERLADRVADFGGSWTFIMIFGTFLIGWALLNTYVLQQKAFDPYPYVFLNLVLSMLAAIQAPVIMMSQNRQAARDRMTMLRDFDVNLKAENAIAGLHKRMEHLTWQLLVGLEDIKRVQRDIATGKDHTETPAAETPQTTQPTPQP